MATASRPLLLAAAIATLVLLCQGAGAATKPTPTAAPGPAAEPLSLTAILEKGSQYATLLRLLKETQIGEQFQNQLNNSYGGMTLFAPTDNAFNSLKPGTLNGLTAQEQAALVLYHVLPRFYSLAMFETASNPVNTQASGDNGVFKLNITSSDHQVNISTGVNRTPVNSALYSVFPLAVYEVDSVLLPNDLFGPKPPPSVSPAPTPMPKKKEPSTAESTKGTAADSTSPSAASFKGRTAGWSSAVVGAAGLLAMVATW